jgi:hypothetical protein
MGSRRRAAMASGFINADEDRAFFGQRAAGADLCLQKGLAEVHTHPMTSPVERILGPSAGSTPGNLLYGKTGDLTKVCGTPARPDSIPSVR